jgi:intergrase/recombinase
MQEEFVYYCTRTNTSEKVAKGYLSGLLRMNPVLVPTDISEYKQKYNTTITDPMKKGLYKFFKYMEAKKMQTSFNGYEIPIWRSNLSMIELTIGSRKKSRTTELSDEDIGKAFDLQEDELKVYYALLVFSGARHEHLCKALKHKFPVEHFPGGVIGINVKSLSDGQKLESYFYFPAAMEKAYQNYELPYNPDTISRKIRNKSPAQNLPFNVASVRKWHYTKMLGSGMQQLYADHIQGRKAKSVGAGVYAGLDALCPGEYAKIVDNLNTILPVPKWMKEGDLPELPVKKVVKNKPPVRNQLSNEKRKEIIQLSSELVNGKKRSIREISKLTGCARETVTKTLKEVEK